MSDTKVIKHAANGKTTTHTSSAVQVNINADLVAEVSVDDVLDYVGAGPFQVLVFLLAGIGYVSYGLEDMTFTFINIPIGKEWNMTSLQFSVLPAMTSVSNIVGAIVFGSLTDLYGRVWPFSVCIGMVGVFTLASALAQSFLVFFVLRLIVSVGTGGIPTFIYPLLMEFLPTKNRGKIASLVKVVQMCGSCIAVGFAWWLIPTYKDNGWRYFIISLSVVSFVSATLRLLFCVQSPRFLINKGDIDGTWRVLSLIAKLNRKDLSLFASKDNLRHYGNKQEIARVNRKNTISVLLMKYFSIFKRRYLRTTITLTFISILSNMGDYGTTLFLPNILETLVPKQYLYFLPLTGLFARIPGLFFMSIIIEWPEVGRIRSLKLFAFLTAFFLFLSGMVRTPVATSVFLLLIFFNMEPITPIMDTYISEVYPTEIRAVTLAFINVTSNIVLIGSPFLDGYIADEASKLPWLFGVVTSTIYFIMFVLSFVLNKETRGRHLTDTVAAPN